MTASSTPTTTASPAVATPQAADNFEANLSYALLKQQSQLREQSKVSKKRGLLILVNGMDHSGKGDAVKALTEWMDARYIKVHATMGQHPSRHQPIWQRHTLQLPRHGEIAIYFGNWYADLIRYVFDSGKHLDNKRLRQMIEDIEAFEQDLVNNHTDIIKCWFSVENKTLKKRLQDANPTLKQLYYVNWFCKKDRQRFYHFGGKLLSLQPHWHHIDGQDITTSNLQFAHIVLGALTRLNQPSAKTLNNQSATNQQSTFRPTALLDALQHPATVTIDKTHYKKQLQAKQAILAKLLSQRGQRHIVFVFEGMDAAGKGGAIRRAIAPLVLALGLDDRPVRGIVTLDESAGPGILQGDRAQLDLDGPGKGLAGRLGDRGPGETPADPLQVHEGLPHLVDGGGDDEIVGQLHEVSLPQQPRPRDS